MSRTRKAMLGVVFSYLHLVISVVGGVVLVPVTLDRLGDRVNGLWQATGELFAYMALAELGMFAVLPWVMATAQGAGNTTRVRECLVNGLVVGVVIGLGLLVVAGFVWPGLVARLNLTEEERAKFWGPLAVLVVGTAAMYPLRVFGCLMIAYQDIAFGGMVRLGASALTVGLSGWMLVGGYGLYALSTAAVVPLILGSLVGLVRCWSIAPEVMTAWPWPSWLSCVELMREGIGPWLAGLGVSLFSGSNGLILSSLGNPEGATVYSCTAKVPLMLLILARMIPDTAFVGLAQLQGEGDKERVRKVVIRLHELGAYLSWTLACVVLAANPAFVVAWVGVERFGGIDLNALLAFNLAVSMMVHLAVTPIAVVGARFQMGVTTLVSGALYVVLAYPLATHWGMVGLSVALLICGAPTTLLVGVLLHHKKLGVGPGELAKAWFAPLCGRLLLPLITAPVLGMWLVDRPFVYTLVVAVPCGIGYVWWTSPLWAHLPFPPRIHWLLTRLRLNTTSVSVP